MRCAYFDCFSGAAGDMILGALVDAGWPLEGLHQVVTALKLPGVRVDADRVTRGGIAATQVRVTVEPGTQTSHRHLPDIKRLVADAGLPPLVAERATRIFARLAQAEARVHGISVDHVHFHEVGAADAIVDIVGACSGLAELGVERIICGPLPLGSGTVTCDHGVLPVPAPATAELLRLAGAPTVPGDEPAEMLTPTGAALLTTLAEAYGPPPALRIAAVGYGAGTRDRPDRPNVLRLVVGELTGTSVGDVEVQTVTVLETQLDEVGGQVAAHACARLLEAGALDAYLVPIIMKKGRPGQLLTVLARPADVAAIEDVLFAETGTLGVRRCDCSRSMLEREQVPVETSFGPIRMKVGRRGPEVLRAWPEYEDCAAAARQHGVALRVVQDAAVQAWMQHDRRGDEPG